MNGKGHLWVTTRHAARDGKVVIEVADEGVGIQTGDQENLFLPYFSKKKTGTGLGLAIVHRIISDHNGRIRAGNHVPTRSEEHTSELQSQSNLVCRLLLEKKKNK